MKKSLLLIIPALLVLSSCQAGPKSKENEERFLEDTLAHEEIFGNVEFDDFNLGVRKAVDPVENPDVGEEISVGVQSTSEKSGHISFRFVAAITFTDDNRDATVAKWTRAVSKPNGTKAMSAGDPIECTSAYKSLSASGDPYTIAQFNSDHHTSHTDFVVYTIRNIPVDSTHNGYYVAAFLNLTVGKVATSKAVVTTVDESLQFAYVPTDGEYFLSGRIGGTDNQMVKATSKRTGGNRAAFEYVDFKEGDNFVLKEFYGVDLFVKDSSILTYGTDDSSYIKQCFEDSNGQIALKSGKAGSYGLYFKLNDDQLAREGDSPYNVGTGYYFKGTQNDWQEDSDYELMHIRNNDGNYGTLKDITFKAGDEFKVWRKSDNYWFGWHSNAGSNFTGDNDGANIRCVNPGTYSIYFKNNVVYVG